MRATAPRHFRGMGLDNIGPRMDAAKASEARYTKHVAPIVAWALAEFGSRRAAHDALTRLQHDDATSDLAYGLLGSAVATLRS